MARQKKYVPDYLFFTRKERTGIIVLLLLILLFITLPFLFPFFITSKTIDHTDFEKEIAVLDMQQQDSTGNYTSRNVDENNFPQYYPATSKNEYSRNSKGELFYFDPNTLPAAGWIKLGVRERTANTILNYVSKGGRFNKPEDIGKIWGLHAGEIKRLLPYVRIAAVSTNDPANPVFSAPPKTYEKPKHNLVVIDINEADTTAFIALPGIGSKLAGRIVSFREKLGGFYKVDQVAETFALPDSTFQKIQNQLILSNPNVKKININTATLDELKIHPYIRYNIANAIVQYRAAHGDFENVNGLKKIMVITDDIYNKVSPYLTTR